MKRITSLFLAVLLVVSVSMIGTGALSDNTWARYEAANENFANATSMESTSILKMAAKSDDETINMAMRVDMDFLKKSDDNIDLRMVVVVPDLDSALSVHIIDGMGYYGDNSYNEIDLYKMPAAADAGISDELIAMMSNVDFKKSYIESSGSKQLANGDTEITMVISPKAVNTIYKQFSKELGMDLKDYDLSLSFTKITYTAVISSDNNFKSQSFDIAGKVSDETDTIRFRVVLNTEITSINSLTAITLPYSPESYTLYDPTLSY